MTSRRSSRPAFSVRVQSRRLFISCGLLAVAVLPFGCGDDPTPSPTSPTITTTPPTTTATTTTASDACTVGQVVRPGQSCTFGSDRFEVGSNGLGCVSNGSVCAGTRLNINGFEASRISGTDNWRIDALP